MTRARRPPGVPLVNPLLVALWVLLAFLGLVALIGLAVHSHHGASRPAPAGSSRALPTGWASAGLG